MALSATYLIEKREKVIQSLSPILHTFAKKLSRDKDLFDLSYSPSISMKKIRENVTEGIESIFKKQRAKELLLGTTLNGPHRDDVGITFHNKEAKIYSSEGQKRTCISALKIAEWSHLAKYSGIKPLLSIDDFGTGYSSLSYLHRIPADTLKIDRSFVSRMDDSPECFQIINSIMSLARNLKMDVIAEGPETEAHVQHLQGLNCDYGQGYFFSRPVEAVKVEQLLSSAFVYAV